MYCYSNIMRDFWIQTCSIQSYNINVTLSSGALQKYWQDVLEEFTKFIVTALAVSVKQARNLTAASLSNQDEDGRDLRDMREAYWTSFEMLEILIAVIKTRVSWDFMSCILVKSPRSLEGTTILRILSLSKWEYVNLKHFGCNIQRYKKPLGILWCRIYIYIYIYIYIFVCLYVCLCMCINSHTELSYIFRRWASNPLSVK